MKEESAKIYEKIKRAQDQKDQFILNMKYFEYLKRYLNERSNYEDLIVPASVGVQDPILQNLLAQLVTLQLKKNTEKIHMKKFIQFSIFLITLLVAVIAETYGQGCVAVRNMASSALGFDSVRTNSWRSPKSCAIRNASWRW